MKDSIGANLYGSKGSVIVFPPTAFVEQTMTMYGTMIGLDHLYSRGMTRLTDDGNLKGNFGEDITGNYHLTSLTVLDGGKAALTDMYDSTTELGTHLIADFIHIENTGVLEVNSGIVFGGVFDIEKSGTVLGLRLGYKPSTGPGKGNSCSSDWSKSRKF